MQNVIHHRRRATVFLLAGVGTCTLGYISAITVTALVAEAISGAATWAGAPVAAAVLGTATGAPLLSAAMRSWGRRRGLVGAYCLFALGGAAAVAAVAREGFVLLLLALFVLGLGNSGNALTRYLVADLHTLERRGLMLSLAVWTGTLGAVVGPNLLAPAGQAAELLGLPRLSGPYLVALGLAVCVASFYFWALRPDPLELVIDSEDEDGQLQGGRLREVLRTAPVQVALTAMVVGHVAMVLIMTMTPVYLGHAGHDLGGIGLVMSAHIFGMFVFSPLTGRAADLFGPVRVLVVAQGLLLAAAALGATSSATSLSAMMFALFLLGLGWNCGFVAGSALLTTGLSLTLRSRLQGYTDATVWLSAASASLASSLLFAGSGYRGLCLAGGALVVVPLAVILGHAGSPTLARAVRQNR